jgi:uncharacterized protein YndB with AHSA1/START domain
LLKIWNPKQNRKKGESNMSYQVKTEKVIERSASDVFRALKEGRLFMNCSADSRSMKIDFRVGGKYHIDFKNHEFSNFGEFLEIIPDKKIVFSWCQDFSADKKPDSQVTIELFADGAKTRMVLVHTGFKNEEICKNHKKGWDTGVSDFGDEIQNGRLRMVRSYKVSAEKLYETCKNPTSFFAFMGDLSKGSVDFKVGGKYKVPNEYGGVEGEFLEIVSGEKIRLSWRAGCGGPFEGSQVTLSFKKKDDGGSSVELVHDGLVTEEAQNSHRHGWEVVTEKMQEILG